ncbi:hypothetical protein SacglDRAFT_00210 [Saccharomonospora glauca K62]|uniref:DUF3558 domain-containing protein n=2 Tax=Saccharomonospora glauca TaxID=40990 RepID=I1CWU9_9PSEU|nr:hypothetical protein SacglDRAFT_00210 [Saccharomonospora glauca K62]
MVLASGMLITGCSLFQSSRSIEPCDLLSSSELSSFGNYGSPERTSRSNYKECTWRNSTTEPFLNTVMPQVGVRVSPDTRFQSQVTGQTADGRPLKERQTDATCTVTLSVFKKPTRKKKGIVEISVAMPDPKDNCVTAHKLADIVSPKLY